MEILAIIFLFWLIGCAFPSSGGGHVDIVGGLASLAAGIIVFGSLFAFWAYSMAGILWLGDHWGWNSGITMLLALFGPIAGPMLIASAIHAALFYRSQRADRASMEPRP